MPIFHLRHICRAKFLVASSTTLQPRNMCGSRGAVSFGTPLLGHPLRGLASLGGYSRAHIPLRGIMPRRSLQIPSPIHVLQSILRVRSTASDAKSPTPLRRYEAGSPLSPNNHHSTTTQQNKMGVGKVPRRYRSLMDAKYAARVWAINCLPRSSLRAA